MKDFVEKYFSTRRRKTDRSVKKWRKKKFSLAGKPASPTMNKFPLQEYFLKSEFPLTSMMVFIFRSSKNPFPLAGIRLVFKNWIPPNFHCQEVIFKKFGSS